MVPELTAWPSHCAHQNTSWWGRRGEGEEGREGGREGREGVREGGREGGRKGGRGNTIPKYT